MSRKLVRASTSGRAAVSETRLPSRNAVFSTSVTGSARRATSAATAVEPEPADDHDRLRPGRPRERHRVREQRLARRPRSAPSGSARSARRAGFPAPRRAAPPARPNPRTGRAARRSAGSTGTCGKRSAKRSGENVVATPTNGTPSRSAISPSCSESPTNSISCRRAPNSRDVASRCGRPFARPPPKPSTRSNLKSASRAKAVDVLDAVVRRDGDAHAHARASAPARAASPPASGWRCSGRACAPRTRPTPRALRGSSGKISSSCLTNGRPQVARYSSRARMRGVP